jgi:DNA-binding response OmpR family regulator
MSAINQVSERYRSRHEGTIKLARILVVEDQELLATIIADVLGDAHEIICAANVADAVDHLLGGDIDIVLLDCVLPDGPNWQVALEADRQDIPVVFMTGDPGQAKELVEGARPYLIKPFGMAELIDVIDSTAPTERCSSNLRSEGDLSSP